MTTEYPNYNIAALKAAIKSGKPFYTVKLKYSDTVYLVNKDVNNV